MNLPNVSIRYFIILKKHINWSSLKQKTLMLMFLSLIWFAVKEKLESINEMG